MDRSFFYIGIRAGDVGLRLIIIIVGHEVLYRVVGEESLELAVQLRRQGLVVAQDEGRPLQALDYVGHGERLAGTRHTQQRNVLHSFGDDVAQLVDGLGLVPGGLVGGAQFELHDLHSANLDHVFGYA